MNKDIVVLGSAGFIGRAVYNKLLDKGLMPRPMDCSSKGFRLDVNNNWLTDVIRGADAVFLCAGRTGGVGRMSSDPLSFIYPNVRIHMNVFEACAALGVRRVVCVQSTTGYPDSPEPMREDQYLEGELHPAYEIPGNAHRFIWRLAQMHQYLDYRIPRADQTLEVVFFRPSNVYGPGNNFDPKNSHVIEATVRKVAERQDPFVIWGDGSESRDATYIDDVAEAITLGLDCPPGAYNLATGEEMNVNEIAQTLFDEVGFFPKVEHDVSKPTAIMRRSLDASKVRALGWKPKVSMREGLARTLRWYEETR